MKKIYNSSSGKKNWRWASFFVLALLIASRAHAQEGSQGNTTIFGGVQMTFFSSHNFATGGGGTQPGVILTDRASGNFGVLNFAGDNLSSANASDQGYVDGYVRKYGAGQFIFPVGDNGNIGQFAASADGTMGAYFHSDANTASTSNLFTGANYPALPTGGPFATSSMGTNVDVVSTIEYWDIDGDNASPLTLTWDAASAIATLTGSQLTKLTIAGWNGTQWVGIDSKVDVTSVLNGASNLTAGSITTTAAIVPDTYTAYTFASLKIPLPVTLVSFNVTKEGQTAQLKWSTTTETNSDRFEIERSLNSKDWYSIGTIASYGESSVMRSYSFADAAPATGENLYRLRMVDKDGTFAYSRIRSLSFDSGQDMFAYPNPTRDKLMIKNFDQVKEVKLLNASGIEVYQARKTSADGIDISKLAPGIYVLSITLFDNTQSAHKIVVGK